MLITDLIKLSDTKFENLAEAAWPVSASSSDEVSMLWFDTQIAMINAALPKLKKALKGTGGTVRSVPGVINVACILAEKFDADMFARSPELKALAEDVLSKLPEQGDWIKVPGFKKAMDKLSQMV